MNTNSIVVSADALYNAICDSTSASKSASAVLRAALETENYGLVVSVANAIEKRTRTAEDKKARICALRVLLKRACKSLEIDALGLKLDKETREYSLVKLEASEKPEESPLDKALALVLENFDNAEVLEKLKAALAGK